LTALVVTMPELTRAVLETKDATGLSIAESFERICRQYDIADGKKDELRHSLMEFLRMIHAP
jgi:hypothetical protein